MGVACMAIVVASGTVHFVMSAVGAAVRVAMHGTSRRTEPVEQAPAAPRARKAQPSATRQGRLAREPSPHHLRDSCMRPPPARSEDGACGEAAMSAGLVTSDSNRGDKVWWPDIAGVMMYHACPCDVAVGMRRSRSRKPTPRCERWW